MFKALLSIGI